MALTGVILVGFVLGHLTGNLLFFRGPAALNEYAEWLHSHALLIWGARAVLILSVFLHIWTGIQLTLENRASRQGGSQVEATRRASVGSRTMPYSGVVILAFIVFHLLHFTFRQVALGSIDFKGDVHAMIKYGFSQPAVAIFYIVGMLLLCLHLGHGVSSIFQTLGLRNERWRARLEAASMALAWVIALGFISIPLAVLTGFVK
jgi:succinate dehydrogenase / fumarate reductase cytochrome b subunit